MCYHTYRLSRRKIVLDIIIIYHNNLREIKNDLKLTHNYTIHNATVCSNLHPR